MSPDLLEKLGALGYLGAGTPDAGASTGADPKDKLDDYKAVNRLMREGLVALRQKDYAGSARRLRRDPGAAGSRASRCTTTSAARWSASGRYREAAAHFEGALKRLPGYTAAYLELAEARAQAGDWKGSLAALREGQKAQPAAGEPVRGGGEALAP